MPAFPTPRTSQAPIVASATAVDPLGRIVRAYDRAIRACESFDRAAACAAIRVLRSALELDGPAARGFDALYAWCEEAVERRDFIGPARTLRALREAWCQAGQPTPISPRKEWPVS
jgi:hypothetical protein